MSKRIHNPIDRYWKNPTPMNAIAAQCARCIGCDKGYLEPGFRERIKTCSCWECPLNAFRPYQGPKTPLAAEAIPLHPLDSVSPDSALKNGSAELVDPDLGGTTDG